MGTRSSRSRSKKAKQGRVATGAPSPNASTTTKSRAQPPAAKTMEPQMSTADSSILTLFEHLRRLPDEIILQILGHNLRLTNGIDSDRWPQVYGVLVKKLLSSHPDIACLVPEALYKNNFVKIRPDHSDRVNYGGPPRIFWPKSAVNQFVRRLELDMHPCSSEQMSRSPYTTMAQFLFRLARGEIGFEKLKVLRLVWEDEQWKGGMDFEVKPHLSRFLNFGSISVRAEKLEVRVLGHEECMERCDHRPIVEPWPSLGAIVNVWNTSHPCYYNYAVCKMITLKGDD